MPVPVIMPKFEMAQESGKILRWLKREGETVAKGEAILEVETDKVAMEVEAPASGTLIGIRASPGEVVPIGEPIAYILLPGEVWSEAPAPSPLPSPAAPRATPLAERLAQAHGLDLSAVPGTGPGGRVTKADVEAYLARQEVGEAYEGKVKAVPAARRLARELSVDLRKVEGTGPGGRIQSADVLRAAAGMQRIAEVEALPHMAVRRRVPLTGMRRAIAERMTRSVREAPQFTVSIDVVMDRALGVVEDLSAWAERAVGVRVTLTALLIRACAWALRRHPALNATLEGEEILEWEDVNIGVAVAVPEGLVVPVVHAADRKGLTEIARELEEKAARAREGRLRPEDLQGGAFTISNLGMYGVDRFTAILNPPQAAILAVGRVARRPVVGEGDRVEVRSMATLTLTADHRIVDGAQAARFLEDLRIALERPGILLG